MMGSVLVIACGALARELRDIVSINGLDSVTVECLPARLHNAPSEIPQAVADRLERARGRYDRVLVGYADCGTRGGLDGVLEDFDAERLPGAHCYEFFATAPVFAAIHDHDPRTFYLTDFLVRHFDRLVVRTLGIDRHPQLLESYFGNYRRVMHLVQVDDPQLEVAARRAAERLGLDYERRLVGYGDLESTLVAISPRPAGKH